MGTVFRRGDSRFWWIGWYDASGKRRLASAETEDEATARGLLSALEKKVRAERELGHRDEGPLTVERYAKTWIERRKERGIASSDDDEARLKHALSSVGHLRLDAVRRVDVRDMVRSLQARKGKRALAPRTILHVYGVLRVMFADALVEELIDSTPCTLKQRLGELPKKRDKDPLWRSTAIYSREEVEQLISDKRIPEFRRVLYAFEFLTGMRANEIMPRRWRDYDAAAVPLGRLTVRSSYNIKTKTEKPATKTGVVREVPVHPTLAKVLAEWKLTGWAKHHPEGRQPTGDDLIVPNEEGDILSSTSALKRLHEHLAQLGLRTRRQHDARRTFISLGIADGARKDLLRWVSHGPDGDIMDLYTTPPWAALCEEVSKLNLRLLAGEVVQLAATSLLRKV